MSFTGKRSPRLFWRGAAGVVLCLFAVSCASTTESHAQTAKRGKAPQANTPKAAKPSKHASPEEIAAREAVLLAMRGGVRAFARGDYAAAEEFFDRALEGIEAVYANTELAAQVRSKYYAEGNKDFKGESYERVMAYYYRGLLDLLKSDFANARASFISGLLQDQFAEEEQHQADFALMTYLAGWAALQNGDTNATSNMHSVQLFEETRQIRPSLPLPSAGDNVLVVVETGTAPVKISEGFQQNELKYFRDAGRKFTEEYAFIKINQGKALQANPVENVYWQATTRGGRQFDSILDGRAQWSASRTKVGGVLASVGNVGSDVGLISGSSGLAAVGGGLSILGGIAQFRATAAKTRADTRQWDNLPDTVHVLTMQLLPGEHVVEARFMDANRKWVTGLEKAVRFTVQPGRPSLVWMRSREVP